MKKFKKILLWTSIVLGTLVLLFYIGGMLADPQFSGSKSVIVEAPPAKVWELLNDTERFSESRHEVDDAEMLPDTPEGRKSWIEHTRLLGTMTYEITRETPGKLLRIRMLKSDFGMSGDWTFKLFPQGKQTKVTLTENSSTKGLFMRSILNVLGRDANMGLLLRALQKEAIK